MLPISKMAAAVQPSATLAAAAKARQLKADGKNIIDFSLGEPDFNPTGSVYSRQELESLADVILEAKLNVISDEIYERLVFGNAKATCFATLRPGLAEQTITISGVSK